VTPFYACEVFSQRLALGGYPNVDHCFLRVIKQLLNTTDSHNMENAFGVAQFFVMGKTNVDLMFLEKRYIKYEALPYGMWIPLYQFGTLTSPNLHDISSLIKPFDVASWFFLVTSVFSVCLYFRIVFKLTKQRSVLEIHIISILLEQSQSVVTKYRSHRTQTGGLLISWMLLVFITGNGYKGVMFSFLTALSIPVVPDTLEEVMESDYLLITMSKRAKYQEDEIIEISTAKANIESILKEVDAGKLKISNSNLYKQFNKTLVFLNPATVSGIFLVMETKGVVWGETKYISIPRKVIFFDSDDIVKLFQELNAIFTKNVVVLGETLHFFSTRSQWIFKRNAFLRLILPIVTGLEESGIYTRWKSFAELTYSYSQLIFSRDMMIKFSKGSKSLLSPHDNIMAYLLFKPHTAESKSVAEPIKMMFFAVVAKLFGFCIVICCTVFIFEKMSKVMIRESFLKLIRQFIFCFYAIRKLIMKA